MADSLDPTALLDELDHRLDGHVIRPGDVGWDEARRAWNLAVDQRPEAVVLAQSDRDVVCTVAAVGRIGWQVAPQATGHSARSLGDLSRTLLLRTDAMQAVDVDPARRTARIGAGARWLDVTGLASAHGLAAVAGLTPGIGVTGYTLGGGLSWLSRSHGLAANSVRSFDVVTADGRQRTVGPDSDPDLFWALRGGGGGFAVVTALEMELYPISEVYAGNLLFPVERAAEVLHAWRCWVAGLPDSVASDGRVLRFPAADELPEQLRGQSFVVVGAACQLGADEAGRLLAPLRALAPAHDTFSPVGMTDLAGIHMDPVDPVPCRVDGALLASLPAEAVDAVVQAVTADSAESLFSFELRHLGGMLEPGRMAGGAVSGLDAEFGVHAVGAAGAAGAAGTADDGELVGDAVTDALRVLRPWTNGTYLNFADRPTDARELFGPSWDRLAAIKAAYDPADLIRSNHPVSRTARAR